MIKKDEARTSTDLPVLAVVGPSIYRGERFEGEVALNLLDNKVVIRDKDEGCVQIKANQLNDLLKFLEGCRDLFEK